MLTYDINRNEAFQERRAVASLTSQLILQIFTHRFRTQKLDDEYVKPLRNQNEQNCREQLNRNKHEF